MRALIAINTSRFGSTSRALLAVTTLVAACLLLAARPAHADTFTVNSTGDGGDVAPSGVCNTAPFQQGTEPECTLRAAIQEANATTAADTINFNIGGSGVKTISPATALPDITQPVTIDGYSEPGASENTETQPGKTNAALKIQLRGTGTSTGVGLTVGIGVSDTVIRGLVISNFGEGILLVGSGSNNRIEGNFIGTDPSGASAAGNGYGVHFSVADDSTLGGASPDKRNLISGNETFGVWLEGGSSGNRIENNLIGVTRNGSSMGNKDTGVMLSSSGPGNRILSNSIFSNGALGIDLGADGVTPNDGVGDADTGPNNLQNFPILTSAKTERRTTIKGTLESTQNGTFTIQFFKNPRAAKDEGKTFVGEKVVSDTDGNGVMSFTFKPANNVKEGLFVTATATNDATGGTSEFSAPRKVRG